MRILIRTTDRDRIYHIQDNDNREISLHEKDAALLAIEIISSVRHWAEILGTVLTPVAKPKPE